MTPLIAAAALLAAILVGYGLGRLRPMQRLDGWMWDARPAQHAVRWWLQEVYAGVVIATHPWLIRRGLRARREQQRAQASAPVEYDPSWATKEPKEPT